MAEVWKDVVGYEGMYQVSNRGRVKSFQRYPVVGRILRTYTCGYGYLYVVLCRGRKREHVLVHRLVAEAFLGSPPEGREVNHRNGDKADNRSGNLEWVTHSQNLKHSYRVLGKEPRKGEANGLSVLTRRKVRQIRKLYATGKHSYRELGKMFGVHHSTIGEIVRRERWKHVP